ncbi:MAG TPA: phosphoribosyltransferase family protein [Actinomycetota bacterium]|nr:phosphoribosyltransferase family protein [Actinomycetota bacterium]
MSFADRRAAGQRLGERLLGLREEETVVLAIPRGGVEVGAEVARALGAPLDVVIPRKVRAPQNPELAIGAVAPGVRVLDERLLTILRVDPEYLDREIATEEAEIARRTEAYRQGRPPVSVARKVAIVVDDGIATGSTAAAAVRWTRAQGAARTILAVPVAPAEAVARLRAEVDEVVVLETPEPFYAVGQWYEEFPQLEDDEVVRLLAEATR